MLVQLSDRVCMCVRVCIPSPSLKRGTPRRKPSDVYRNTNRPKYSPFTPIHVSFNLHQLQRGTTLLNTARTVNCSSLQPKGQGKQCLCNLPSHQSTQECIHGGVGTLRTCTTKLVAREILQRSVRQKALSSVPKLLSSDLGVQRSTYLRCMQVQYMCSTRSTCEEVMLMQKVDATGAASTHTQCQCHKGKMKLHTCVFSQPVS